MTPSATTAPADLEPFTTAPGVTPAPGLGTHPIPETPTRRGPTRGRVVLHLHQLVDLERPVVLVGGREVLVGRGRTDVDVPAGTTRVEVHRRPLRSRWPDAATVEVPEDGDVVLRWVASRQRRAEGRLDVVATRR